MIPLQKLVNFVEVYKRVCGAGRPTERRSEGGGLQGRIDLPVFASAPGMLPVRPSPAGPGTEFAGTDGWAAEAEDWSRWCGASSSFYLYRLFSVGRPFEVFLWRGYKVYNSWKYRGTILCELCVRHNGVRAWMLPLLASSVYRVFMETWLVTARTLNLLSLLRLLFPYFNSFQPPIAILRRDGEDVIHFL